LKDEGHRFDLGFLEYPIWQFDQLKHFVMLQNVLPQLIEAIEC
jgi:hypothetical protein